MKSYFYNLEAFTLIIAALLFAIPVYAQAAEIEGQLEVLHTDDFENPSNSGYVFYLRVGQQRYELQSDEQLPLVTSGTPAKVKGRIEGNKIIVENFALKGDEFEKLGAGLGSQAKETSEKAGLSKMYLTGAAIVIVIFLLYIILKRRARAGSLKQDAALRNYIAANLRKGYPKQQIRNALLKDGYTNQEIEEAFRRVR